MNRLSLIIATYNRGEKLLRTLQSLEKQTLDSDLYEIAVVNNNSTDNTGLIAEKFVEQHPQMNIKVLFEPQQGLSYTRNCGIRNTSGEYIVIIDDDETVGNDFLQVYYDFFESYPDAVGAGGRILPVYETQRPQWMSKYTEGPIAGTLYLSDKIIPLPKGRFFMGGNMAVRRSILEQYGMFNTELGRKGTQLLAGEEKDLFRRITANGEKCYFLPKAVIHHIIPPSRLTEEYFTKVCYQIGRSEKMRTENQSTGTYFKRLLDEAIKWCATIVLALGFALSLRLQKARYLLLMRCFITKGLMEKKAR